MLFALESFVEGILKNENLAHQDNIDLDKFEAFVSERLLSMKIFFSNLCKK